MNVAFKRIVAATDFGSVSEFALEYAKTLAARFGAELHLLHVVEEPFPSGAEFYITEAVEFRKRLVANADERLAGLAANLGLREVTCHIRIGNPARVITETAAAQDADLIVMGTHGRGGVTHLIMGSVAERVVRNAACPVLTVHESTAAAEAVPLHAVAASVR